MFQTEQYQLLDFGGGRKLERFGNILTDRPSPPASGTAPRAPRRWREADLFFRNDEKEKSVGSFGVRGIWQARTPEGTAFLESGGTVVHTVPNFTLELKGSPFGHLGIFPEQSPNWDRLYRLCRQGAEKLARPIRVLNLFAYTGGSSLACAAAGAEVTHVDAARNIVAQSRRNAELSGLKDAPIHWIADDAVKYVKREEKRKKEYEGIILDPPAYGHGARGEVWRLTRDLPRLLSALSVILAPDFFFILLTCHSPGFDALRLAALLSDLRPGRIESGAMSLTAATGAKLSAGYFALLSSCR